MFVCIHVTRQSTHRIVPKIKAQMTPSLHLLRAWGQVSRSSRPFVACLSATSPSRRLSWFRAEQLNSVMVPGLRMPLHSTAVTAKGKKGKAKGGKTKSGGGTTSSAAAAAAIDGAVDFSKTDDEFAAVVKAYESSLAAISSGKASPTVLDGVKVPGSDGTDLPLNAVAQVVAKDPQTLVVTIFDESMAAAVETAIRDSGLGLSPARSGTTVKVAMPRMTTDYRQSLVKRAKVALEGSKKRLRRNRSDGLNIVKKASKGDGLGKDDAKLMEKYVGDAASSTEAELERMFREKSSQLLK